ncbi:MAG: secondary thiamine-phosphate synthase enzyme YjbQ [Balneolaceae bacterium]
MVEHHTISLNTTGNSHMHDITEEVQNILEQSKFSNGICTVFNVGSTATIGTIEFEPGLERDLPELLNKYIPPSKEYGHEKQWHDGNGHSHLQATTMGPSITIPFENSRLKNGTWQQIFHLECDNKPRNREIIVTLIGE